MSQKQNMNGNSFIKTGRGHSEGLNITSSKTVKAWGLGNNNELNQNWIIKPSTGSKSLKNVNSYKNYKTIQ